MNRKYVLAAVGAGAGALLLAGGLAFAQSNSGSDGARRHGMGMGMGMGGQEGMQRGMHRGRGMQQGTGQGTDDSNEGRAEGRGQRGNHGMGGHGMGRHGMGGGEGASGHGMGRGHGMGGGHGMEGRQGMGGHGGRGRGPSEGTGQRSGALSFEPAALAALKSELGITAAQEAAWSRYEKAAQAMHTARTDRAGMDREAVRSMAPADRFAFATGMREEMRKLGDELRAAGDALLEALDAGQREKAAGILSDDAGQGRGPGRRAASAAGAHRH